MSYGNIGKDRQRDKSQIEPKRNRFSNFSIQTGKCYKTMLTYKQANPSACISLFTQIDEVCFLQKQKRRF